MADVTPILEMKNVGKIYSQNGRAIEALRGANLTVKKGEFICLIGASGCGKSTLLRMAAGFEAATSGDTLMWGMPIKGPGPSRGMVFQDYGLFPWLNVRDNIGFGPKSRGRAKAEIRETSDRFIELVEIWSRTGLTVLFVTHSIEEAIFLADRVVVMSPGPGRIEREYRIELPRPRDIASPEFNEWRRLLSSQLHSHHARKAG
ncbi:MAG TPA: ABC transporter ATP-binding protein [Bradyrhizobium sp.]